MTKILVIEDDELMYKMYSRLLSIEGFEVILATGGQEGIKKAKSELPALILLDIMMPKIDGLQVLRQLKSDEATKNIPVLVLTNLGAETIVNEACNLGAAQYLVKSETRNDDLIKIIHEYVK